MLEGLIVKALSGYYYVKPLYDGNIISGEDPSVQCRACGIFKKKGISPLVGDRVMYSLTENGEGTVDEILPRSSQLIRPPVANVDLAVLLFSVREPNLSLHLLDKFLVHIEHAGLDALICLTKQDLANSSDDTLEQVKLQYEKIGYEVLITSSLQGTGTQQVKDRLAGRISVFSGQSGVGKSSLLNAIMPGLSLETSEISSRLGRGRHTTRHVELMELDNGGYVADTPGFSQLDFGVGRRGIVSCFKEFAPYAAECKFRGCSHLQEPGCKVIQAKDEGLIMPSRYEHYVEFYNEMRDKKRRY